MQTAAAVPSEGQDVWRIDFRTVARLKAGEQHFDKLQYYRWQNSRWQISDAETFFGTQQAEIPVSFFALGFTLTTSQITQTGFNIVRNFDPSKPCRIVFLDWYSDRSDGTYRRDIRSRIPVADNTGNYLTLLLQKLEPQSKVCLFGFSLGCRILGSAAEALATNEQRPEGLRLHVVLSGAAIDWDTFAKGRQYGDVPQIAEKMMITYSPSDWALRFYPMMYGIRCRPAALGLKGLPIQNIDPAYRDRLDNIDVTRYNSGQHQTLTHIQNPAFRSLINTYFFFE